MRVGKHSDPLEITNLNILNDKDRQQAECLMTMTLAIMGWEIMNQSYGRDLATRDFHLFGPPKKLTGKKFQTDYETKCGVMN
jgi:hypothetical protein